MEEGIKAISQSGAEFSQSNTGKKGKAIRQRNKEFFGE
jgi:hypothetical protein